MNPETPEDGMITLLRGGQIFSPENLGKKDILISGHKIAAITEPDQIRIEGVRVKEVSATGKIVTPGFIDGHVHILGGGGEGGPATRAPEIAIEDIIQSGVTTVVGCLGTDGVTRHMQSLLAKARGLEIEGITTFIFSGSYEIPVKTLTGSVRSDLILIQKVIGAGEIAVSDHRSAQPSFEEFAKLAAECRVGGMLGGKAGILHCHLGDGERRLELLFRLIEETEIPITQVIPTHSNRNPGLLSEAIKFMGLGGFIDLTADEDPDPQDQGHLSVASSIQLCQENRAPLSHLTISSDSNGSMPVFDKSGNLVGLTIATQKSLLNNFRFLIEQKIVGPEEAVRLFSTNPAAFYKFQTKGEIKPGKDADILLFDNDYHLTDVFAMGNTMMESGELIVKGTFS
jgi:beta-aspartyl-dipeptidase (metallo-type)